MKGRLLLAGAIALAAVQPAQAQGGSPNSGCAGITGDACQQAVDIFQYMAPQLGLALTGGNPILGSGGTLGGFPHIALSVRGVAFQGDLPDVENFPTPGISGPQARSLPSKTQFIGLPNVDAAIGVFKGIPLGVTNIGGVDVLVNATYIPEIDGSSAGVSITPETNLKIGYGARVGLLQESILVPGVSLTWVKRDLPTTTITADASSGTVFHVNDMAVKTTAIRAVASKSFLIFGLAVGAGQDSYDQSANVVASNSGVSSNTVAMAQKMTRTNIFANLSLNLPLLKLVGEAGQVSGGDVKTYNTFEGGEASKSRTYFSAGLRLQF